MGDRIEKLKAMLAQVPDDSFLQHALALEYVKLNDDKEAKALFEAVLAKNEKYIGSYYHLAKLYERAGEGDKALAVYEKGMTVAKAVGDNHALNELRGAWEEAHP